MVTLTADARPLDTAMRSRLGDRLAGQDIGFIAGCIYVAMAATSAPLLVVFHYIESLEARIALVAVWALGWLWFVTYLGIMGRRVSDSISERYTGVSAISGAIVVICSLGCLLIGQGSVLTIVFWTDMAFFPAYLIVFYLLLLVKGRAHVQTLFLMVAFLGVALCSWMLGG